ncbi:hypothetical protein [Zooshikella ganghwensis]|uniref:Uncharacterized protein n=1 Tax=Zooshikella ganghwensis TaxID=202772 RepID=A0A4P9VJK2_9GAMM|nr:hypothetical protein [Zooshikella ganghwensis]RDH43413.1 hypothetical protein B9G39_08150 [Zooshikella ganghwensis]
MKLFYQFFLCLMFTLSSSVFSNELTTSAYTQIESVDAFADFGDGDIIFNLVAKVNGCERGYWISKNHPGYNTTVSMIIAAYQAKSRVLVRGYAQRRWKGSAGPFCQLYSIRYVPN